MAKTDVGHAIFIAVGYAISSSCLVVINKWALKAWPYASTLTFIQFTVSWMVALALGKLGIFEVDALEWKKVKAFSPACLIFFVAIACNMKLLAAANVDTFIVLRSTVPLLTSFGEALFLGSALPPRNALLCLLVIVMGAVGYVHTDTNFSMTAYLWGTAYVVSMVVDTLLVKKVVTEVELKPWGLVLYNNLIASALYPLFVVVTGEAAFVTKGLRALTEPGSAALGAVLASCVFGVSISYFGMNARKKLVATAFSVLGVVCKFATVLVNTMVWDNHATPVGIFFLMICLAGGIAYQQVMKSQALTKELPTTQK